jgi:threonine aldolase
MTVPRRHFASDNCAAICPKALAALIEANTDHAPSYGADRWTAEATRLIREAFETDCEVFFVFNGTAANSLALASLCDSFDSVLCAEHAHIATDECGAPGFFAHGTTITRIPTTHGKLSPEAIVQAASARRDIHHSRARAVSLTQSTEFGTVYAAPEIGAISEAAHGLGLAVHMDGARFANAVAGLGTTPRAITHDAGIDVLSLGGTKNGLPFGEAVVFFDRDLARHFEYRRKQAAQLASKMRFLAAPWVGVLRDGAWLRYASHANAMAAELERGLRELPGVTIAHPRGANAVFAMLPPEMTTALHAKGWHFYSDVDPSGAARLMCSWDTTAEDVAAFLRDARGA